MPVLVQGVEPLVQGVVAPVALFGVALSWLLDGVAGVEGVVVVVVWVVLVGVVVVVVLLLGVEVVVVLWAAFMSLELDGVVLVLCASANVPVRSKPAA